jgi:hypothetical protein
MIHDRQNTKEMDGINGTACHDNFFALAKDWDTLQTKFAQEERRSTAMFSCGRCFFKIAKFTDD